MESHIQQRPLRTLPVSKAGSSMHMGVAGEGVNVNRGVRCQ
jgi:hypothetical protein